MNNDAFTYRLELPNDSAVVEALHIEVFGPGRFARAAYRLREGIPHDPMLSFVAQADKDLIASVRLTPIVIGDRPALLLGPLVVAPSVKGQGAGKNLVRIAVKAAREADHKLVMLVGDEDYYRSLGFHRLDAYAILLPAPVDPERVLVACLVDGALDGLHGSVTRAAKATK